MSFGKVVYWMVFWYSQDDIFRTLAKFLRPDEHMAISGLPVTGRALSSQTLSIQRDPE
jgi:hypothetical protein